MGYKTIPLPNNKLAMVDDEDYDRFKDFTWFQHSRGYVFRWGKDNGKKRQVFLHKEIMQVKKSEAVKFREENPLDMRKANLFRLPKHMVSHHSTREVPSSKYTGVYLDKVAKRFRTVISFKGKPHYIGSFVDEDIAGLAYDYYSRRFYGKFAKLNFPDKVMTKEQLRDMIQKSRGHTSRYRGVSFFPKLNMWRARIVHQDHTIDLKLHKSEVKAAKAYDAAAKKLKGSAAKLNF